MENLEKQVDDILENRRDIISLRGKLNAIANTRANSNLSKNTQNIERYGLIVDYFLEKDEEGNYINKDRVSQNRAYLSDIMYDLSKKITTARFGYPVFEEGNDNFSLVKGVYNKINNMLNKAGFFTGISGTGTGTGVVI